MNNTVELAIKVYSLIIQVRRMQRKLHETLKKLEQAMSPEEFTQYVEQVDIIDAEETSGSSIES